MIVQINMKSKVAHSRPGAQSWEIVVCIVSRCYPGSYRYFHKGENDATKFSISEISSSVVEWELEDTYRTIEFMVYLSVCLFVDFKF